MQSFDLIRTHWKQKGTVCLLLALLAQWPLYGEGVVINEVMYHPPEDSDRLQFIELFNPTKQSIDLSGWYFDKGVRLKLPEGTKLAAGAFLVVCKDREAFSENYTASIPAIGDFKGRLSHSGERIRLVNASGETVDELAYKDGKDWPRGPDGYSASLERISPIVRSESPYHWAPSKMPEMKAPMGTPGRWNDSYSPVELPQVFDISHAPDWPNPGEGVTISAKVTSREGIVRATLLYRSARSGSESEIAELPMTVEGDEASVVLPGQETGTLIRFQIRVESGNESVRIVPSNEEPIPALSYFVGDIPSMDKIGHGLVINVGRSERGVGKFNRPRLGTREREPSRGNAAFVFYPDKETTPQLFDFIRITPRHGGLKLRFHSEAPYDGVSVLNVLNEGDPRYLLSEFLSFEMFRRAGVPSPKAGHLRLTIDGRSAGHYLTVEQPNRSFLERHSRDRNGNLYKLQWFGRGVIDQHEKKTNRHQGYEDVVQTISGLRRLEGENQWRYIQQHFNVPEFASYYAVNMCISNWDGFFNNHFVYHDTADTGKWEVYPWDQDKTWGDCDGGPSDYSWYALPLTSGMNGVPSPSGGKYYFRKSYFDGAAWWRPPGHFSGPILANEAFRKVFLNRLRELCHGVFSEPQFLSVIDDLETRLLPEITYSARVRNSARMRNGRSGNVEEQFRDQMDSFRRQLKHRRTFILKELSALEN